MAGGGVIDPSLLGGGEGLAPGRRYDPEEKLFRIDDLKVVADEEHSGWILLPPHAVQ